MATSLLIAVYPYIIFVVRRGNKYNTFMAYLLTLYLIHTVLPIRSTLLSVSKVGG